jgi:hypothetical protein
VLCYPALSCLVFLCFVWEGPCLVLEGRCPRVRVWVWVWVRIWVGVMIVGANRNRNPNPCLVGPCCYYHGVDPWHRQGVCACARQARMQHHHCRQDRRFLIFVLVLSWCCVVFLWSFCCLSVVFPLSCLALPCLVLSCLVLSCLILACLGLPCLALLCSWLNLAWLGLASREFS